MSLKIIKPGLLTTVQDLGRRGYQKEGIIVSGAMDRLSLRLGNLLVGNPEGAAALEINLLGPDIFFESDQLISLSGASISTRINEQPLPFYRPLWVKKGSLLKIGTVKSGNLSIGCRSYLTVSGSFNLPEVMGSTSTYLRAGLGGYQGRALQEGDLLPCNSSSAQARPLIEQLQKVTDANFFVQANWGITLHHLQKSKNTPAEAPLLLRAMRGPEWELFSTKSRQAFWQEEFLLSPQSDRMGCRLQGPALSLKEPIEILSSAVTFGSVQVPPGGNPIVLGADHQTTGGYPRIAQLISADFSLLAQARPGSRICFREVSLKEAQQAYLQQEQLMEQLKQSIALKIKYSA